MKRQSRMLIAISAILCVLILCTTVCLLRNKYYDLNDFDSIVIGESSIMDVWLIAPNNMFCVTSYGGCLEYDMKDGGRIIVEFQGPDYVVRNIRIIE